MPSFDHLIFDCDGVIVDSEIVATRISLRLLRPYGYQADELTHAERYAGLLEHEILTRLREDEGLTLPPDFGRELVSEITSQMFEALQPVPGIRDLVLQLDRPLTVVSNSKIPHVRRSLELAGVREAVGDRIFSAEQVAQPKPHPDVYLHTVGSMHYDPQRTLVVEDSVAGVTAAKAAGLAVIGFLGASHISASHGARLKAVGADALADDANALQDLLHAWLA